MKELLGYQGKRVVVTGAASGMGEATTRLLIDLGAEVCALDIKEVTLPVKQSIKINMANGAEIDAAVKKITGNIDALFNCAGVPGPPFSDLDTVLINFVGLRHLTEALLPKISSGGAIASISSIGGITWRANLDTVNKLLATKDFDEARAWLEANPDAARDRAYAFSKECVTVYTKRRAAELAKRAIRINCICPSGVETPMWPFFIKAYGKERAAQGMPPIGRLAKPEEGAEPLIFLNSNMARYLSGQAIYIDYGMEGMVATM